MFCIYCGKKIKSTDKFCPWCGKPTTWISHTFPAQKPTYAQQAQSSPTNLPPTPPVSAKPVPPAKSIKAVIPSTSLTSRSNESLNATRRNSSAKWAIGITVTLICVVALITTAFVLLNNRGLKNTSGLSGSQASSKSLHGKASKTRRSSAATRAKEPSQHEIISAAQNGDFSPIAGTYCSGAHNCLTLDKEGHITGTDVDTFSGDPHDIDSHVSLGTNDVFTFSGEAPGTMLVLNPPASEVVCHHSDGSTTTGKQCVDDNTSGQVMRPKIDKPDYYLYFFRHPGLTRDEYLDAYKGLVMDKNSQKPNRAPNGSKPFIVTEPSFYSAAWRNASEVFVLTQPAR